MPTHHYFPNVPSSNIDSYIYDHAWSRVGGHAGGSLGVGINEARIWHRKAYGGMASYLSLHWATMADG
jgi:hypothetical protein